MNKSHLDAEYSLPEQHVACGSVDVVIARVTGVDHESIHKLHGLSSLTPQLARDHNLAASGA